MRLDILNRGLAATLGAWILIQAASVQLSDQLAITSLNTLTLILGATTLLYLGLLALALSLRTHSAAWLVLSLPGAAGLLSQWMPLLWA